MRQTISCAIVVFNEERNIREALDSVAWMDEIIAVDSYSIDNTVEICREFTPHVFQRKWNGFGEQKNFRSIMLHQSGFLFWMPMSGSVTISVEKSNAC